MIENNMLYNIWREAEWEKAKGILLSLVAGFHRENLSNLPKEFDENFAAYKEFQTLVNEFIKVVDDNGYIS